GVRPAIQADLPLTVGGILHDEHRHTVEVPPQGVTDGDDRDLVGLVEIERVRVLPQ
ncbi:MAG: hypothetical protein GTO14_17560, partial [Anaerolineales bacterium]|nr:hypothetical protein [Anaerolineales bacterium]